MKSLGSFNNVLMLIVILVVLGILYRRFENKRLEEENMDSYNAIRKYLHLDKDLITSKKPILWIHVPYEYNSRNWLSFGSRTSLDLNQPYLYLTIRSIIEKSSNSFKICIIDDQSFEKLIPNWNINVKTISDPILLNIRQLGLMKLLYIYGGMVCPISFLCMKNLIDMYKIGTRNNKMFICENNNHNITSSTYEFYPDIYFCGATKENPTIYKLIDFMQRIISTDTTSQSVFLGDFNRWCEARVNENKINIISGLDIGIKNIEEEPIKLEDLISQNYLKLYPNTYGIYIPSNEILKRRKYEWFARLSEKQVLESDTIIGKYLLLSITPIAQQSILEPLKTKPNWVGFWKTPGYPGLYGLKPNFLGDNLLRSSYTGR
jgi:hypothetical protein